MQIHRTRHARLTPFLVAIILCLVSPSQAQESEVAISSCLRLGPVAQRMPAFNQVKDINGGRFGLPEMLKFEQVDHKNWWPAAGQVVDWSVDQKLVWSPIESNDVGDLIIAAPDSNLSRLSFLATYLNTTRWSKTKLQLSSAHPFQVYLDGSLVGTESGNGELLALEEEIELETGKHLLLIKSMSDPGKPGDWCVNLRLADTEPAPGNISATIDPKHPVNLHRLLDTPRVQDVMISPKGDLVALQMRQTLPPSNASESWVEIRRVRDGVIAQSYRSSPNISSFKWSKGSDRFAYLSHNEDKATLWSGDDETGEVTALLKDEENLSEYIWAPDGASIIYSLALQPEEDDSGVRRLRGMIDRQPGLRTRDFLYQVNLPQGRKRRLTAGSLSTNQAAISPDGHSLLFYREAIDDSRRPYIRTELFLMDLTTLEIDSLFAVYSWFGEAHWAPDGRRLLILGGGSTFPSLDHPVAAGKIINEYDTQGFIYDLATGAVDYFTRDFRPALLGAIWSHRNNRIYLRASEGSYQRLYQYDLKKRSFKPFNAAAEVVRRFDIAGAAPVAAYLGSSANEPPRVYSHHLRKNESHLVFDPGSEQFRHVQLGAVRRWAFNNQEGTKIEGRVYYPPGFDAGRQYPCIVYYYSGTVPTERAFGGRYPKNLYAANGYIVYVLQPSGATGYGMDFSARHVNNWGKTVADEIILGVGKFLDAHPFVDRNRVGCIGASYGGFMTMLLQTRTDMFAAAVAHAGISDISSYWGEGYWGYLYSAVATANSFPWNRPDIYVDQSPLFHADKVQTPTLLLHGNADTNVPPGESIQFYTALKLLGKEVELIEVDGQNHHILQYNKRILWKKSILAWFDRWLKAEPEWWQNMYGE